MKKTTFVLAALALVTVVTPTLAADTFKLDTRHSYIGFKVKHLGYSNLIGRFNTLEGQFTFDDKNPAASSVDIKVDVTSVDTNDSERNGHIRGEKLLNADAFPAATFKSTKIEVTGEHTAKITGDLTVFGKAHQIVVDAEHVGGGDDPWGGYRQGFTGKTTVSMKDLGVQMDLGPASDSVELEIELEGVRQ